jgi:AAA15 family ATPase/GTPase
LNNPVCEEAMLFFKKTLKISEPVHKNLDAKTAYAAQTFYNIITNKEEDSGIYQSLKDELRFFGFAVEDIKIEEFKNPSKENEYSVYIKETGLGEWLPLSFAGEGNIKLFRNIVNLFVTMYAGGILVVDEFDQNFHPVLLKRIMSRIHQENTVGQFIFTMHNTNILRNDILRRDQIYFVDKNDNHCSELYALSDFKVHKNAVIEKQYLEGIFGALPVFIED